MVKRGPVLFAAAVLALAAIYFVVRQRQHGLPETNIPDLDANKSAGHVDRLQGVAYIRNSVPEDLQNHLLSAVPENSDVAKKSGWVAANQDDKYYLGSLFRLAQGSSLQVLTAGNWLLVLDGDGEFIFEDARTDQEHFSHRATWLVKKGIFRAKPYDYEHGPHELEVVTPTARVLVHSGEIGLKTGEDGKGDVWLMAGKAEVVWNDGKHKELALKSVEKI